MLSVLKEKMSETRRFLKGGAIDDGTPLLQLQI